MVQPGGGEEPVVLCTLCAGGLDTVPLDQFFSHYTEFTVKGGAPIHVTGWVSLGARPQGHAGVRGRGAEHSIGEGGWHVDLAQRDAHPLSRRAGPLAGGPHAHRARPLASPLLP
jgi:hypothetical protein